MLSNIFKIESLMSFDLNWDSKIGKKYQCTKKQG